MRSKGLAFKLIVFILGGTGIVFVSAFLYYYTESKQSVLKYVEENAGNLARATVSRIETVLGGVEKVPLNFSGLLSMRRYRPEEIPQLVEQMVAGNPEVYGSAIAFEPRALDPDVYYFSPYCHRKPNGCVVHSLLGGAAYQYFNMDWYQIPRQLNRPVWTEPYYDEGGGDIVMATFSAPFYRKRDGGDPFQGVATADISLSWLNSLVLDIKLFQSGYAFLISQNGVFITHPDSGLIMRHSIFSIAEEMGSNLLRSIGKAMVRGGEGLVALESNLLSPRKSWLYFAPLSRAGCT